MTKSEFEKLYLSIKEDFEDLQRHFSDVMSFLPTPFFTATHSSIIVDVNNAFEKLTGYPIEEAVGLVASKLFKDREKANKIEQETMEKGGVKGQELIMLTKNKRELPVSIDTTIRKDAAGNVIGYIASIYELTELKRAEEERTRALMEQAATMDSIADPLVVVDLEGNIVSMNKVMEESLTRDGLNPKELIGKPALEIPLIRPGDVGRLAELMKEAVEKGKAGPTEVFIQRPDGSVGWNSFTVSVMKDKDGNPKAFIALTRDITELKRAEEERREAEVVRERATIAEAMGDGLALVGMDGKMIYTNPALEKMTGYPPSVAAGKDAIEMVKKFIKPEEIEKVIRVLGTTLEGKIPPALPITVIAKDGREVHMSFTVSFIKDLEGNPSIIVATLRDITDLKRAEEVLKAKSKELEAKIKELEEFHDLAVGRELKMKKMEEEMEELKKKLEEKEK